MIDDLRGLLLKGATAIAIAAPATMASAQSLVAERDFNIPAQPVGDALLVFSRQSDIQIITASGRIGTRRSRAVSGRMTAQAALARLLEGTGLTSREIGQGSVIVRPAADAGEPQAASDTAAPQDSEIVVTGTNLRGAQPTSPLITISRRQIEESGATSVEDLMRQLPQNFGGGIGDDNFFATQPGIDLSEFGEGLNLRGLGQRATLTLVNGRRLAPSNGGAFVDISLIPITAVQRIEVLTDGASAIYGSDAVGGVVNFILRDDFRGLETVALAGTTTNGDGDQLQLGLTAGHAWASGHALVSYEYRREDEVLVRDRDFNIGGNPDTLFLPRERRHSLFGLLEQDLADSLSLELNASFTHREIERNYSLPEFALPVAVQQESDQLNLAGQFRYDLGAGWAARIEALYSISDTDNLQTQPEIDAFVNARAISTEIYGAALKVDGDLFELPGGTAKAAIGAELRWEDFTEDFRNRQLQRSLTGDRRVRSAFAELLVPFFSRSNRRPGFERLQLSAAARYEDYGVLGSSLDPKVGLLWSPLPDLTMRASYGTSFRVPLLSETQGAFNVLYVPADVLYLDSSQATGIGLYVTGRDPDIGPETSRTWTFGGEFSPRFAPGLTLSANYYAIRFGNRIAAPLTIVTVIGDPAFEPLVNRNPSLADVQGLIDGSFIPPLDLSGQPGGAGPEDVTVILDGRTTNTAITTTRGIDLTANYTLSLGENRFVLDANANHIISFRDRITPASASRDNFNIPYRPLAWRGRLGLSWTRGQVGGTVAINHAAGYRDNRAVIERRVGAFTSVNAGLSYTFDTRFLRGTRLSLFVENLLDTNPPFLVPDPNRSTGAGYDPVNANGRGRFISLQIRRSW